MKRKLDSVCSKESYVWLQAWIKNEFPSMRYPLEPKDFFYKNVKHREYLSKFIESVIVKVLRSYGADPEKPNDKGKSIDTSKEFIDVVGFTRKIGGRTFIKDKNVKAGRADIKCFFNGKMYNMEVKVGKDRLSDQQKIEMQRALKNGEEYIIIKTVDDFIELINKSKK